MQPLDMGAAWQDTKQLLRYNQALWLPVAGVFLVLPQIALALMLPEPEVAADGGDGLAAMQGLVSYFRDLLPYLVGVALVSLIGQLAIYCLWFNRDGLSVGEALARSAALVPAAILMLLVTGIAIYGGILLLIIPGLYLMGRLALVFPLMVDRRISSPVAILQQAWAATAENGWRIFLMLFVVMVAGAVVTLLGAGIFGAIGGMMDTDLPGKLAEGVLGGLFAVLQLAVTAAIYRQLTMQGVSETFE